MKNLLFLFILLFLNNVVLASWEQGFLHNNLNDQATDQELAAITAYINIYRFIYKNKSYELSEEFLCKNHCFRIATEEQKNIIELRLAEKVNSCLRNACTESAKFELKHHNLCSNIYFIEIDLRININDSPHTLKSFFPDLHPARLSLDVAQKKFVKNWVYSDIEESGFGVSKKTRLS